MPKSQIIVISSSILLFCTLYLGFDTKPKNHAAIEQKRAQNTESTSINSLLLDARKDLTPETSATLLSLEQQIGEDTNDSTKADIYKQISSTWFSIGRADLAGFYAQQVAEIVDTEEAWSIAGTSYTIGIKNAKEQKIKDYCFGRAVKAFENAISFNPLNVNHKINLALCYIENPLASNPMQGILMLRDLNEKNPENVGVLNNLGRLGIQTGQFERAITRLEKAVELEKNNALANCLLAQAYEGIGDTAKAKTFKEKCTTLSN